MARCQPHRQLQPCFYCERGVGPFVNSDERLEILELRVRQLEQRDRSLQNIEPSKTNLVIRMGGVGDLVMLSSSLQALKAKEPRRPLVLATIPENIDLLAGADYLDGVIPILNWGEAKFHHKYDLRYAVEPPGIGPGKLSWADYIARDRSDVFDDLLGVESKKEFSLPISQEALGAVQKRLGPCLAPLIGIAPTCRSPIRVMPPEYVEPLARLVLKKYRGTVVLFGKTEPWTRHLASIRIPHVINLIDAISLPEMIALCSLMDAVISPDTATTHVAATAASIFFHASVICRSSSAFSPPSSTPSNAA